MHRSLLIFVNVLILSNSVLFSQSQQKEVLDKLPAPNQESSLTSIPLKSYLPCNFYKNIATSYIGISDVKVDSATAFHQAYIRALSMVALGKGLARGMSDFYNDTNGEQTSSIYEELSELKTSCNLPIAGLKVTDTFLLKSGELVLFMSIDSTNVKCEERVNLNSTVAIYCKENETDGSGKNFNKISLENKLFYTGKEDRHTEKLTYIVSNNRWLSNETLFDNRKIETNRYKIFYEPDVECIGDTTGYKELGTSSVDGLWCGLINNLYRQLSVQLKDHYLKVKKVGDQYQDKLITLNRETGFFRFGCSIIDGTLIDNKILTRIKVSYQ